MPVTQKDIARHVGVSRSSVAQVLTGIGFQTPKLREEILQAARDLGYRPNMLARALVTGKTHTIGVWYSPYIDPVAMRFINGMDRQVRPYKMTLNNVGQRGHSLNLPDEFPVADWPVDGVVALSIGDLPEWMMENGKPSRPFVSVVYDAFPYRPEAEIDTILVKIKPGNEAALQHLIATRQRIAMLCVESMPRYNDVRVQAYEAAMKAAGRKPEYILHPLQQPLRQVTRQAVIDHVKAHGCPDALFCGNDEQAIAAHGALHQLGHRVPEDVALIGNDGLEEAEYHVPSLSTVALPVDDMVRVAWEFLQKRMAEPEAPRQYTELDASLMLRESSQV
jgi:LacI family transcriptional regulator